LGGSKTFIDKSFFQSFTLKYDLKLGNGRFDIDSSDPLNDTADRVKTMLIALIGKLIQMYQQS
jgi:hypothetical protein